MCWRLQSSQKVAYQRSCIVYCTWGASVRCSPDDKASPRSCNRFDLPAGYFLASRRRCSPFPARLPRPPPLPQCFLPRAGRSSCLLAGFSPSRDRIGRIWSPDGTPGLVASEGPLGGLHDRCSHCRDALAHRTCPGPGVPGLYWILKQSKIIMNFLLY